MKSKITPHKATQQPSHRVLSIDALRGFIMILMALDHANMLLSKGSSSEFWGGPLPRSEDSLAFFTRFVTHLCAPGFFFLMGIGMVYFWHSRSERGWSLQQIRHYFAKRGALIVAIHFAMSILFAIPSLIAGRFGIVYNVLYILGFSMIAAAWFLQMPISLLTFLCTGALLLPEFVLGEPSTFGTPVHPLMRLLTVPGYMGNSVVLYTFFPWFGLTLLGIISGRLMMKNHQAFFRRLPLISASALGLFMALRLLNVFGNLRPMEGTGWMAFLQLTKYPPSLTFMLMMIGVNLGLLYVLDKMPADMLKPQHPLLVFGRSALFFYVIHHFVFIAMMYAGLRNLPLRAMYPFWILGVLITYPLCRRYAAFKHKKPAESLWHFF
ncbi:MAG: heparan-alpha-glucosaminide N-acetyltransferase domain-containing protein [Bacillota bacterium]|nr:heparan-alpha-glucosaminide N-acetyltransferase domain-containing protein [Bacillota bacterium]